MAKELPYFKFVVADWLTGDIVFEPFEVQGLFINICAIYWQRGGVLSIEDVNKRYKHPKELSEITDRFISVTDGFISINFLDEQLSEREYLSRANSKNGKKGGRPKVLKTLEEKPTANRPLTDQKANESNKEKKRKEKIIEVIEYFNFVAGKNFSPDTKETIKLLGARLEKYEIEDCKKVIDVKTEQWKNNAEMQKYLCPSTLFAESNFEKYLNEKPSTHKKDIKPIMAADIFPHANK